MPSKDFTQPFYLVVNALIQNAEGKVLLLFSKKVGGWSLPGGKVEQGEHPVDAVIREVAEETGLIVKPIELLGAVDYNFRVDGYTVNLLYRVEVVAGEIHNREPEKHSDMGYREVSDLPNIFTGLTNQ